MGAICGKIAFGSASVDKLLFQSALSLNTCISPIPKILRNSRKARVASFGDELIGGEESTLIVALDGDLHDQGNLTKILGVQPGARSARMFATAWRRWQDDTPKVVYGDYAAACFDPEKNRLVLTRDHIGTRPLYWHWDDDVLSFATFLPVLLALLPHKPTPDESSVAAFLRSPITIGSRTFFKGIHSVEPGYQVIIDTTGPSLRKWWNTNDVPSIRFRRPKEYAEALREITEQAVEDRISDNGTIGSHLSGGLDSTTVALIAQEKLGLEDRSLKRVYSWSPPISPEAPDMGVSDERHRINKICSDANLNYMFSMLAGADIRAALMRPIEHEGLADVFDEFPTLEQAKMDGVRIILSGWGGDEAFSSHALDLPAYFLATGDIRSLAKLVSSFHRGYRQTPKVIKMLWQYGIVPLLPDFLHDRLHSNDDIYQIGCYLHPTLAALPSNDTPNRALRITGDPTAFMRKHIGMGHVEERMKTWAAWSAPYSIEYRYPLTDRRLMEFVIGVPPEALWGDNRPRYLARAAINGRINSQISKSDPANERKRMSAFMGCWEILADEVKSGLFDDDCPWLDMSALRRDLLRGPSGNETSDLFGFARIMPAVRIWHMAQRMDVVRSRQEQTVGSLT